MLGKVTSGTCMLGMSIVGHSMLGTFTSGKRHAGMCNSGRLMAGHSNLGHGISGIRMVGIVSLSQNALDDGCDADGAAGRVAEATDVGVATLADAALLVT